MIQALVIDDDLGNLQSCRSLLERFAGIPVLTAETGFEGLRLARESTVRVIVADLKLPDMNGLDVIRRIRAAGIHTPFIVVTGFGSIATAIGALRLGATDYFEKPYSPDDLLNAVDAAVGGRVVASVSLPALSRVPLHRTEPHDRGNRIAFEGKTSATSDESDARVKDVLTVLTSSLRDRLDIRGLAQQVNVGDSRLRQIFRTVMGTSLTRFRNDCRLAEAARLLTETYKRVSEIAYDVGFQPSTLDRLFRRRFGASPREYRRRNRRDRK